ncbi:MAG: S8 family serine peptidase [bacterium]|nr:S8 family serine peptidase [bacterium]
MTVGRVHSLYGVSDLAAMDLDGQGVTVSVVSLGRFNPHSYSLWTSCLGLDSPVQPVETDVFVESGLPQEAELDLDIDTIVAVAPHLDSLEAITVDEFGWVGRPFAAALNEEGVPPDVISSSIGFCEAQLDAQSVELAEYSLAALASVGTTVVTTSGDFGSAACQVDEPTTSVQYPASSAFVTAVGGTQLGSDGTDQVTWYEANRFASGGGTSTLVDRPGYQAEGDGRQVPDIALLASPSDLPPIPTCTSEGCTWSATGGTSAAGPLFAGAIAQIKQLMRQQGRVPVGSLNPLLYRFATEPDGYTDISVGSNDIYGLGCCNADIGFDLTTGWGAPDIRAFADYAVNAAPMAP